MMVKGWSGIITGLVITLVLMLMWQDSIQGMQEANKIRENGYYYNGTTQITTEQYEYLKKYDGFHGGIVKITTLEPLTIGYAFGSLEKIDYLKTEPFNAVEQDKLVIYQVALPILMAIPFLMISYGFCTLSSKNKSNKLEEKV